MQTVFELKTRAFGKDCRKIGCVEVIAAFPEWPFFGMCRMVTDWEERVDDYAWRFANLSF